ncbi:MAG TPA: ABC transporter substrate-binding protein [Candidatus Woesebacteria bacterium]|nr:ABC transporter substrate-binding protein [Candidatus Woesebacteria bacterium]
MRKFYWYFTAYLKKHGLTVLISVVGTILLFSVLMPFLMKQITFKDRQYIGIVGEYSLQNLPKEIKNHLSMGLTRIDPEDQSIKPYLAERWISENDGKTYRFTIRKDLFWHDGQPLTPDTINYNLKDVEMISTPNDLIFKLPAAFAPFPAIVTEPVLKQTLNRYLIFFKRPTVVGLGSYRLANYRQRGNRLQEVVLDSPESRLIYRFYLTEQEALLGFKKGEVDTLQDIRQPTDVLNWNTGSVTVEKKINPDQYLAVFFNHSQPLLTRNLKQALAYALEKPQGADRALGPINPLSWAYLEGGKDYAKDWDRAVERIMAALPTTPLKLTLSTTPLYNTEADQIKQQWEEFGRFAVTKCQEQAKEDEKPLCANLAMEIQLKISNFPDTQDYQLLLMGQEIPIDPDQYFLWHSDQPTNFTRFKNTRIDSLLEKGRQTLEQKERQVIYQEFQQFLLEDPPAIFLYYLPSFTIKRS